MGCSGPSSNGRTPVFGTGGGGSNPPGPTRMSALTFSFAFALLLWPIQGVGQVAVSGTDTAAIIADSGDIRGAARAAQASFERRRQRYFPFRLAPSSGGCDETVGRLCVRYGEGEWYPTPEATEARALRSELLATLDSLQAMITGDSWLLGQRVWYRAEGGDWESALEVARDCGLAPSWWCKALEGLALHGLGRYEDSATAFNQALVGMEPGVAVNWRIPDRAVDSEARNFLRRYQNLGDDSLAVGLNRLWMMADPLYIVPGNDRLTAHYARWTVATLKDGARNPYRLRWGRDLEELTVRNGWEVGWERSFGSTPGNSNTVTGHQDNEARDYMPTGRALGAPGLADFTDFAVGRERPRSLYQPPYAPVFLPMEGQLAVFPRGNRTLLVATYFLPEDTTFHANHDHPRPWLEPGDQSEMDDQIGLFAVAVGSEHTVRKGRTGQTQGALVLDVPTGSYIISAESWSPARRRAGRFRIGLDLDPVPEDIATLSDLLLLESDGSTPQSLEEAASTALARAEIPIGANLGIAWEVSGLGFRPEIFQFEVSVDKTDRSIFRRVGEFFGLAEQSASLALSWEEPGPDQPAQHFRHLDLDLPDLDSGRYEVTLTLKTPGRSDTVSIRTFSVVED